MTGVATDRAESADQEGHGNRVNRCDDPDGRRSSQLCDPVVLPVVLPTSSGIPDAPDVPACIGWLFRFEVVTLVVAAILCGLATVALLMLSWSFFALSALLAPSGLCIPLLAVAAALAG